MAAPPCTAPAPLHRDPAPSPDRGRSPLKEHGPEIPPIVNQTNVQHGLRPVCQQDHRPADHRRSLPALPHDPAPLLLRLQNSASPSTR
jgi:hypothetical protein